MSEAAAVEIGEEYSYDAKSNAILFSSFFILFFVGATGISNKMEISTSDKILMAVAFAVGMLTGWFSSDYPVGEGSDGALHGRGAAMMTVFGLGPLLTQILYLLKSDKKDLKLNIHMIALAMGGLLGHSMARLRVDLEGKVGHEIHLGWYAATVGLVGLSFLIAVYNSFSLTDRGKAMITRFRESRAASKAWRAARAGDPNFNDRQIPEELDARAKLSRQESVKEPLNGFPATSSSLDT